MHVLPRSANGFSGVLLPIKELVDTCAQLKGSSASELQIEFKYSSVIFEGISLKNAVSSHPPVIDECQTIQVTIDKRVAYPSCYEISSPATLG